MINKFINKLSCEIETKTKEVGGIHSFVQSDENKSTIASWLESITDIAHIFNEKNGFELEVDNQKYHNCYFKVGRYYANEKAMFIGVYGIKDGWQDTEEYFIDTVTVFNSKAAYDTNRITVKEKFVPVLRELNIIKSDKREIFEMQECHNAMDYADKHFCICFVDDKKIKEFSKEWNYQYE